MSVSTKASGFVMPGSDTTAINDEQIERKDIFILHPSDLLTDHIPHGDGLIAFGFIKGLAKCGWRIHIAAVDVKIRQPLPDNVFVYQIKRQSKSEFAWRLEYMFKARRLLSSLKRQHNIALVHQMNPVYAGLSLGMVASGLPIVLGTYVARWPYGTNENASCKSIDNPLPLKEVGARFIRKTITLPQQLSASALLITSSAARSRLAAPNRMEHKIITIRHGIDTNLFSPEEGWQKKVLDRKIPRILFYSHTNAWKGIYVLMGAYKRLVERVPDCQLTVAGMGGADTALRTFAKSFSGPNQVEILGEIDRNNAPGLFRRHSIYCLPSFGEPYATTLLEAMSCAQAVVVSDAGGLPEMVPQGGGLRVKVGDSSSLCDALFKLVKSPELQVSMGTVNRNHAVNYHSWARVTKELESVYLNLLE